MARCVARAIGAVVARFLHTEEVTGSNPVSPTKSCLPGLHFQKVDVNKPTRRISSIVSLRKWEHLVTRGDDWFVAFGRLYVFDPEGTQRIANEMRHHPFPGTNGRLFRTASRKQTPNRTSPESVLISGLGRFGNGVQQFVHATSFSLETGANEILFFPNPSTAQGLTGAGDGLRFRALLRPLVPSKWTPRTIWRSDFFEPGERVHTFEGRASQTVRPALQSIYAALLGGETLETETLTIHLRSGDVFRDRPHPGYGQPPLAFYQRVIDSEDWQQVEIVSEDDSNPCHGPILDYLSGRGIPSHTSGASLSEATRSISQARNLVVSRGTFAPAVLFLSDARKRVFVFGREIDKIPSGPNHDYWYVSDRSGQYVEGLLSSNWQNSAIQRRMMVDYPKKNLTEPSQNFN